MYQQQPHEEFNVQQPNEEFVNQQNEFVPPEQIPNEFITSQQPTELSQTPDFTVRFNTLKMETEMRESKN